jgi:C1A family cysteine protease
MKFTIAALLGVASAADMETERAYIAYLAEHGKSYGTREEFNFRLEIFAEKMKFVEEHNSRNSDDHTVELNMFADYTDAEYKKLLGYRSSNRVKNANYHQAVEAAPASIDWREHGAVTPVKNQGQCGSCWSFSATGSMEGAHAIATKTLVSLSEQQLMDCSTSFGNQSCNGGLMDYAF